jgi:hypothetical protein
MREIEPDDDVYTSFNHYPRNHARIMADSFTDRAWDRHNALVLTDKVAVRVPLSLYALADFIAGRKAARSEIDWTCVLPRFKPEPLSPVKPPQVTGQEYLLPYKVVVRWVYHMMVRTHPGERSIHYHVNRLMLDTH